MKEVKFFLNDESEATPDFRVGSLNCEQDLQTAVALIKKGGIVAAQVRGVFGIWADASNSEAVQKILEAKGQTEAKTFSSMLFSQDFLPLIDKEAVSPRFLTLLEDAKSCQRAIGAICHLRAPIKPAVINQIPLSLLSHCEGRDYMHNLDPFGHPISMLIRRARATGVRFLAVSSLNDHAKGEKEITDLGRAKEFCQESQAVPLLLTDPSPRREEIRGSFAIIDLLTKQALRDGHISVSLIEKILNLTLNKKGMKPATFPQANFPPLFELNLSPQETAIALRLWIRG